MDSWITATITGGWSPKRITFFQMGFLLFESGRHFILEEDEVVIVVFHQPLLVDFRPVPMQSELGSQSNVQTATTLHYFCLF
jgi:hypothetical protein